MQCISPLLRFTCAAALLSLLAACGSEDGAPPDSTITFSPSAINQTTVAQITSASDIQHVNVTLRSGGNQPLSDTGFLLNTAPGILVYEGELSLSDLASADPIPVPTMVSTGQFGSKMLTVLYPVGAAVGTFTLMEAWSGTAYEKWDVTYTCQDGDGDGVGLDCPEGG